VDLRRRIFKYSSLQFGQDIGYQDEDTIYYMEAYKRYTGRYSQVYRQISSGSWDKLTKTADLDLVIVSALYGLLKYNESIRYCDTTMKNKIGYQTLKTWWRKNGLCTILNDYISENKILEVHFVLSNDYRRALGGCGTDVKSTYHDFAKHISGSNTYRGKWVNNFIQNF